MTTLDLKLNMKQKVLKAVSIAKQGQQFRVADIQQQLYATDATLVPTKSLSTYLSTMCTEGLIDRVGHGVYENVQKVEVIGKAVEPVEAKLQLEVGKTYIDGYGDVFHVMAENTIRGWMITCDKDGALFSYEKDGKDTSSTDPRAALIKEHVEPKTKDVWVVLFKDKDGLFSLSFDTIEAVDEKKATEASVDNHYWQIQDIKKVTMVEGKFRNVD